MTGVAKLCFASHTTTPRRIAPRTRTASAEREQCQGEHTTIGRKSEWIILGSLLTEVLSICFSRLHSKMLTANHCRAATVSASPFIRKKATRNGSLLCLYLLNYRTFLDDYLRILDFIAWIQEFYPEKLPLKR